MSPVGTDLVVDDGPWISPAGDTLPEALLGHTLSTGTGKGLELAVSKEQV